MKLLLIDTCGANGSIVLADADSAPDLPPASAAVATLPGRTASERLLPAIRQLAADAGISLSSLDAICVVHGPGSFTGVRVGLSAAKGLSEALAVPLVAVSRLAVLAHLAAPPPGVPVHALLDAGRGEFYSGLYLDGACLREALLTRDQVIDARGTHPAPLVVACEPSVANSLTELSPKLLAEPSALDALPLALIRIRQQDFDDPVTLDANYLRRTDAEIFAKPKASSARAAQHSANSSAPPTV